MKPRVRECHPVGILPSQNQSMEDTYLCPDCRAEHSEPLEPALGHLVRCASCVMLLEILSDEQAFRREILEIRVAA